MSRRIQVVNLRNLDLNLLLVFEGVHKEASITKAAEILGLTQPAVSNALNRLRRHIDDPFFVRTKMGMEPTSTAQRIAPILSKSLKAVEASLSANVAFDPRTSNREFNIMLPDALEPMIMYPLLRKAAEEVPGFVLCASGLGAGLQAENYIQGC